MSRLSYFFGVGAAEVVRPDRGKVVCIVIEKLRNFQARKSLGQNFLHDENIVRKIARAITPKPGELIVEIGPGFGILTRHLLASNCRYVGIEIDQRLIAELRERFDGYPNFDLRHADFRTFDLAELAAEPQSVRIVGNIPYHITSSIIFAAFESHALIADMTLMVQKEVAERIVAAPGSKAYGILSVISQTFADAEILFTISPHVFVPKPDVDSAVVRWTFGSPRRFRPDDAEFFREVVKRAFGQRRKTLRNGLKALGDVDGFARACGFDLQRRAETLTIDEMIELANALRKYLLTKQR